MSTYKFDLRSAATEEISKAMGKLKIDLSGVNKSMEEFNATLKRIAEDIQKQKDNAMAMEFARVICELLKENGVVVETKEFECENHATNKFEIKYGVSFTGLDFTEHDKKVTAEKDAQIVELKRNLKECQEETNSWRHELARLNEECDTMDKMCRELRQDCAKRVSEIEERHQTDCIRINQLLATIDVLTERYQKLREIHGL